MNRFHTSQGSINSNIVFWLLVLHILIRNGVGEVKGRRKSNKYVCTLVSLIFSEF